MLYRTCGAVTVIDFVLSSGQGRGRLSASEAREVLRAYLDPAADAGISVAVLDRETLRRAARGELEGVVELRVDGVPLGAGSEELVRLPGPVKGTDAGA